MPNSREFAWKDIKVYLKGRQVTEIREITYETEVEKELVYASGSKARTIGRGNEKCSGEITILQSGLEALQRAAGTGNKITDIQISSIIITYSNELGAPLVTDIITDVEFTKIPKGMKQNDKHAEHKLPFIALNIEYNA